MKISIKVAGKVVTATLTDSKTTQDFISLLPLTLTMNDLFKREKFAHLPRAISKEGKRTHSYQVGDVAYWSPGQDVAIFYRHDGQEIPDPGIIVIGRIDFGVEAMKLPAASCGVSQKLPHSELPEIFLRLPLPLHIPFDNLPVCPFPYRSHIVPVGPKLPTPQDPLHRRLSAKNLARRDALEDLYTPAWSHFRMRTAEQVDVILVGPNGFHLDRKPFRNLNRRLPDNRRHHLIQQRLPGFHGKHKMVVDLPRTVRSLSNCLLPLVRHTPEGTRKDCPRSKLRGITS
jgi:hypothetical protein